MRYFTATNFVTFKQTYACYGASLAAAGFGLFILYVAGLTQPDLLHNAAHDSRHALAFPCH